MRDHRRQGGSALFVTIIMLALMGALGIAALETIARDQQVAGNQYRARSAFYAAEAAASEARDLVRTVGARTDTPAFFTEGAPQLLGDAGEHTYGRPSYYGDPDIGGPPIRWVKDGTVWGEGGNLQMKGQKFVHTLWQINVEGQTQDGTERKLEVMESKILSSGY